MEKKLTDDAVQNSIFIFSGLWDNKTQQEQNSEKIYPFKDLFTNIWQN